jgi:hypothetical protein
MKRSYLKFTIRYLLLTTYCLLLSVFLWGCGGSSSGGGEAVYDTVTLTASPAKTSIDSDVAKHSVGSTDDAYCTSTDTITYKADTVSVTVQSTTISNLPDFVEPSRVRLQKVTVKYTPANQSSPSLPEQYYTLGTYVDAGGSATVEVTIASQSQKMGATLYALQCTSKIYSYYVTIKFDAIEINSDQEESFETTLNVNFADYIDE